MKSLIFDTGPIISMTLNHLSWVFEPLKKQFGGKFYITESVKKELVDRPLETKRFEFEALHTLRLIRNGLFEVYEFKKYRAAAKELMELANNIFKAKGSFIQVCHAGEMEVLALAEALKPEAVVIDERTTRELIEEPEKVREHLERRLHTRVSKDQKNFDSLHGRIKEIKVLRSIELAAACFEMGLLDRYKPEGKDGKKTLLDSVLWGIKLNGCAVSADDISQILQIELFN